MSGSSETKPPSFSQTCSMLYQFLKEKGTNLNDLNLDMQLPNHNGSGEMFRQMTQQQQPKNYFLFMDKSRNAQAARGFKSMDLFPQQAGFGSSLPKLTDNSSLKNTVASVEHQMAQMTIFYDGKVHVYNNLPAEKAKEVMLLASQESSKAHQAAHISAPVNTIANTGFASQFGKVQMTSGTAPVAPSSNPFPKFGNPVIQQQEAIKPTPTRPIITDIPMQRKASLQRFLAKRKDRINNMAPYQMSSPGSSYNPSKPAADGKSWLGLAAQPTQ